MRAALVAGLLSLTASCAARAETYRARDGASLQGALARANASPGPSTIQLSAGAFLPTSPLTVSSDVTIVGPSTAPAAELEGSAVAPFPSDLLVVDARAKATLWNVELTSAGGGQSGAAIDDFGAVDIESSTLAGNSGPGLLVQQGAAATVRNSTFSDGLGFGIVDLGRASLLNATIAGNATGVDDSAGSLTLTNTIVAKNRGLDCTRRAISSDHSLDGDGSCGVGALSATDPALARLAANGGATLTRALLPGSPAIDAGDQARCPGDDQRHFARADGHCDIGAYEAGPAPSAAQPPSGSGSGSGPGRSRKSLAGGLLGVRGHGALRGARGSPIAFSVRALVGHANAAFLYSDRRAGVMLRGLRVSSLALDRTRRAATLRGSCVDTTRGRRVGATIVLTSLAAHGSLRIRLSDGYQKSGGVIGGSITFMRRAKASAAIVRRQPDRLAAVAPGSRPLPAGRAQVSRPLRGSSRWRPCERPWRRCYELVCEPLPSGEYLRVSASTRGRLGTRT